MSTPRCPECGWNDNGQLEAHTYAFGGGQYLTGADSESAVWQCEACDCDAPVSQWVPDEVAA